jgi:hypothetical protein
MRTGTTFSGLIFFPETRFSGLIFFPTFAKNSE